MNRAIQRFLTRRDLALYLVPLAVLVCAPALWLGWVADDLFHQATILGIDGYPEAKRSPLDMFRFAGGEGDEQRRLVDAGSWPWWTAEDLRLGFLRPVTGLTHGLDYALWPRSPMLMHAHSLLWLAFAVAAATRLYRRLLPSPAVAGLAALLFALDEAHGMSATWVANRNSGIAVVFVLLALLAYDRLRRDGWRPGVVWTPLLVLLGLLANEGAVAAGAYLAAYALFLDRGTWQERLLALAPTAAIGALWAAAYKLLGYGTVGSGVYIDPGTTPARFAQAAVERAPGLVRGLLAWPPADLDVVLARSAQPLAWWLSLGVAALFAALFWWLLRRDPRARFFALGATLSLAPACSTFPSNRLLIMASIGGLGLIAQLLAGLWRTALGGGARRWPARAMAALLVVMHVFLAPLGILATMNDMGRLGAVIERAAASLPSGEQVRKQWVLIVQTPSAFVSIYGPLIRALRRQPVPAQTLILGSSVHPIAVERRGERTLVLRPEAGFLPPPGTPRPGDEDPPAVDPVYVFQMLDHLFRDQQLDPLELGERIELTGLAIEVTAVVDGRPAEVSFRFARTLEDPALRWLRWHDGIYVPFELPAGGETVVLEPARIR